MKKRHIALIAVGAFVVFAALNNTNLFSSAPTGRPLLLAHRGLAQTYSAEGVGNDTCTASRIHPPEHPYIENTLASMEAAFRAGADIVELDIHPTTDGQFAVFHDWTLDCATNGNGVTREQTMATLKTLDVGYGYTADGGKTFPQRGKGIGLMPTLDEVFAAFPRKRFLIHIKSNDPAEGEKVADRLKTLPPEQLAGLMVYGGNRPVLAVRERLPQVPTMSNRLELSCLLTYLATGWSGHVPASCAHSLLLIPDNYAGWLWGWPDRFLARMQGVSSVVVVAGPHRSGDGTRGIDSAEQLKTVPLRANVGIWTNRVDRIAPLLPAKRATRLSERHGQSRVTGPELVIRADAAVFAAE
ncbi:MAG: glycerophosphodiester phosphodiesterase [Xanthobacteraceae bacterium]|nr:glycerophosphodiester phosphodiesterase [Xanthobacteraceae bacterium]